MRLVILTSILGLGLPLSAAVQAPRDRPAQTAPAASTGAIRGRVTDRETGAPVARAGISLFYRLEGPFEGAPPRPRQTETDANGRYAFEALAPGSYTLSFSPPEFKVIYLQQFYGATRPLGLTSGSGPKPVVLAAGQVVEGADIALWRSLTVFGRVTDELGEPLTGVPIVATNPTGGGRGGMRGPYQVVSDDRGSFRVFGLAPGRYVLCASMNQLGVGPRDDVRERYVKTCAPSALTEAEGQVVELGTTDFGEVEIRMQRGRTYRVTGAAVDSQGAPVGQVSVIRLENGGGMTSSGAAADRTGRFTFGGLTPGDYAIRAEAGSRMNPTDNREREIGYVPFRIDATDVDGLVVTTAKGSTVSGHLTFEGTSPPASGGVRVSLSYAPNQSMMLMGPPANAEVKPDLTFTLPGVFGSPTLVVNGLPKGWVVKTVRTGDRDVTELPAEFKNGDRIEVIISNRGGTLTGRVVPAQGSSIEEYRVVLLPAERERWSLTGMSRLTAAKPDGTFSVGPVRPGEYLVALVSLDDRSYFLNGPEGLERLAKVAQRVTLLEDETKQMELTAGR